MLVIDENRSMGSSEEALSELERMIVRDRNHPSVVLWSLATRNGGWRTTIAVRVSQGHAGAGEATGPDPLDDGRFERRLEPCVASVADVMGYNYIAHATPTSTTKSSRGSPASDGRDNDPGHARRLLYGREARALGAAREWKLRRNVELGLRTTPRASTSRALLLDGVRLPRRVDSLWVPP